jgi:hypothetical protein
MNFSIVSFIIDRNNLTFEKFKAKYDNKIPHSITIVDAISKLKNSGSIDLMIDKCWYGDSRDEHLHYLLKNMNKYEVFISERNGQHCVESFDNFEDATFAKLDALFNEIGHAAPDSIINL